MQHNPVTAFKNQTNVHVRIAKWLMAALLTCTVVLQPAAQTSTIKKIDSLKHILKNTALPADTNKVKNLAALSSADFTVDYNEGLEYGKQALALAEKLNWQRGAALANNAIGRNYWAKSDYLHALECYQKALEVFTQTGDELNTILSLSNIGSANYAGAHYNKALEYFEHALKIAETSKAKSLRPLIYSENGLLLFIASTYAAKLDYAKAVDYCKRAVAGNDAQGDEPDAAYCLVSQAAFEYLLKNYSAGDQSINRALAIFRKQNDKSGEGKAYEMIAAMKIQTYDYPAAIKFYSNAVNDFIVANDKGHLAANYSGLGQAYLDIVRSPAHAADGSEITFGYTRHDALANAIANLEKAVSIGVTINSLVALQQYLQCLADAYELLGDNAKALATLRRYDAFKDSLTNTEKKRKYTEQLLEYEYNKQKDSLNYVNKLQQSRLQTLQQEQELAQLKLHQQLLYSITGITVLGLFASLLVFRNRLQRVRFKNELEKEKSDKLLKEAEFNSRMNDITFSALRSQMNSHFIFNCLNSIKLYTEQNNSEAASEYLTKFSRLIRSILDSARADNITLASELQLLKLYLEMEAMRFKEKLQYFINVNENIDTEFIDIPPLIIQPYVENAIWHGLMHKLEGGIIKIDITMQQPGLLVISVEDNGVGRAKAATLKSKNAVQDKSFGTKLTAERIALINEKYKTSAQIITTDLFDKNNNACGTLVTIKLPLK